MHSGHAPIYHRVSALYSAKELKTVKRGGKLICNGVYWPKWQHFILTPPSSIYNQYINN